MHPKSPKWLQDIADACALIRGATQDQTLVGYEQDAVVRSAVERNFEIIEQVHESGVAVLVVEQNANVSLAIADRGYVLSTGRVVLSGAAAELREHEDLRKAYLGR